jgi:hypothetical protein
VNEHGLRSNDTGIILIVMRIERRSPTVFTPLDDGTGVLLNLDTLLYFSLNHTGAVLWQQIEEGKATTLDDLVQIACTRFEIAEQEVRPFISEFAERLEQLKMIKLS